MESTVVLQGTFQIRKNNMHVGTLIGTLSYDNELQFFKVIANGNIWTSFKHTQVMNVIPTSSGSLFKTHLLTIYVKFPNGDEFAFASQVASPEAAQQAKAAIERIIVSAGGREDVLKLLKTREKVDLREVSSALSKHGLPSKDSDAQGVIESFIASGKVEGVFEGNAFVSRYALQRETVRYDIVTKFEVGSNGVVVLNCPNCGASIPLDQRMSTGKCRYCGSAYTVPKKILDLISG